MKNKLIQALALCLLMPMLMLIYAGPVFSGQQTSESVSGVDKDAIFVVTGDIRLNEASKKEAKQVYELLDEKKEVYKLIGPKAILDQIISIAGYSKLKFKITGQLIKKDRKKGILISSFEIYKPAEEPAVTPGVAPAAATSETGVKNSLPADTSENKTVR